MARAPRSRAHLGRACSAALGVTLVLVSDLCAADNQSCDITLVQAPPAVPALVTLAFRVRAELDAAGLPSCGVTNKGGALVTELAQTLNSSNGLRIALGVAEAEAGLQVLVAARTGSAAPALWRFTGPADAAASLALRAADAVRAVLAGRPVEGERVVAPAAAPVVVGPPPAVVPPARVSQLNAVAAFGALSLDPGGSLTTSLGPVVSIGRGLGGAWSAAVSGFWAMGDARTSRAPAGEGSITTGWLALEGRCSLRPGNALVPFLIASAGVARVAVDARPGPDFAAYPSTHLAAVARVGAGLTVRLATRWALGASLEGVGLAPLLDVRLAGAPAAGVGRPGLMATLGLSFLWSQTGSNR